MSRWIGLIQKDVKREVSPEISVPRPLRFGPTAALYSLLSDNNLSKLPIVLSHLSDLFVNCVGPSSYIGSAMPNRV